MNMLAQLTITLWIQGSVEANLQLYLTMAYCLHRLVMRAMPLPDAAWRWLTGFGVSRQG